MNSKRLARLPRPYSWVKVIAAGGGGGYNFDIYQFRDAKQYWGFEEFMNTQELNRAYIRLS
ncbi:MAG: hypothetical protein L0332_07015 [Chloroflexi bacterium]|nr:hypothetical protein [Chloroflexota bacterium]MCI0647949.1 hypothetical protein [Chloroflexota bacterium]MCI0726459.1 hypothetical protein [Chloroflexota bacterium]